MNCIRFRSHTQNLLDTKDDEFTKFLSSLSRRSKRKSEKIVARRDLEPRIPFISYRFFWTRGRVARWLIGARASILPLSGAKMPGLAALVNPALIGGGGGRRGARTQSRWSLAARTCVCGFQHAWAMLWHATRPLHVRNVTVAGRRERARGEIQKGEPGGLPRICSTNTCMPLTRRWAREKAAVV